MPKGRAATDGVSARPSQDDHIGCGPAQHGMIAPLVIDGPINCEWFEAVGATMTFLPPFSPDLNPIEKAFSKLKALLRKAAERTVTGLWDRIGKLIELVEPEEAQNYFNSCGYDPK